MNNATWLEAWSTFAAACIGLLAFGGAVVAAYVVWQTLRVTRESLAHAKADGVDQRTLLVQQLELQQQALADQAATNETQRRALERQLTVNDSQLAALERDRVELTLEKRERIMAQAVRVTSSFVEVGTHGQVYADVVNASGAPILRVIVSASINAALHSRPSAAVAILQPQATIRRETSFEPYAANRDLSGATVFVEFIDADGVQWKSGSNGRLLTRATDRDSWVTFRAAPDDPGPAASAF